MVNSTGPAISPAQLRAARAWLNWSQDRLAQEAGVSKGAVNRFERDAGLPHATTAERLQKALEEFGIEFVFERNVAKGVFGGPPKSGV